ncbi:diacylglycerol kinase [soil metagenome]
MEMALVVNPASGKRRGEAIGIETANLLNAAGFSVRTLQGVSEKDTVRLVDEAIDEGIDALIVVGGDGLVHLVAQRIAGTTVVMGIVPAGTGNDTARALGVPRAHTRDAVDIIVAGLVRPIDLAHADGTYVSTVVASGFDSRVNERANTMRWPRGRMRYNIAMVAELGVFKPLAFHLELDGVTLDVEAMLVAVGNGPSFGGGLRICEGAVIDDGLLDVVIIGPVSKARLVRVFPKLYKGTHITEPSYQRHRVTSVILDSPGIVAYGDGERLGPLPRTITVAPGALRVFVPASLDTSA